MNKIALFAATLLATSSLAGCSFFASSIDTETRTPVEITDGQGTREMQTNPSRVAVFSFDILDILDTVGLEQAGIDVLGLPKASIPLMYRDTYNVDSVVNIGTLFVPNYDALDLFDPELIIISNRQLTVLPDLIAAYPNADILDASLPNYELREGMSRNVTNLAKLFPGVAQELQDNFAAIETAWSSIEAKTADYDAMFLLVNANAISFYGPTGRYAMLHDELGFGAADPDTSEGGSHGKSVSFEYVVSINPEVLFLMDRGAAVGNEATVNDVKNNSLIATTQAATADRIYVLDPVAWYITTGGFQAARQMMVDVNQFLSDINQAVTVPSFE